MECYLKVMRDNYSNFTGCARRQEYWMFAFINLIVGLLLGIVDTAVFGNDLHLLSGLYGLAILISGLAVAVRRLHDTDRSGWWVLLSLIPIVGVVALIVMMCIESTHGNNRFRADPKGQLPKMI